MTLDIKQFVKIATSLQNFALQNKTKQNEKDIYVVFGNDDVTPEYNSITLADAFILRSNKEPMSMSRGDIPGAVYIAPADSFAHIGLKVWTEA